MIRLTRLTETSLIVHWFSESYGLIKTVAKGALRPKSLFAGQIDLFFSGEISFSRARRGELHSLREVLIQDCRQSLRENYTSTLLAAYCCQLLESAVEPEHSDPELYNLLSRVLTHLEVKLPRLNSLHHFENELVKILGVYHKQRSTETALRDTLGSLPAIRNKIIERLLQREDFSSSNQNLSS